MNLSTVPAHVPPHLVFDYDYVEANDSREDPYAIPLSLAERGAPGLFFTPRHGGHWVAWKYDDIFHFFRDAQNFSTYPNGVPPYKTEPERMAPFEYEGEDHAKYRSILAPLFTPAATRRNEAEIRKVAIELIEAVLDQGEADFMKAVGGRLPGTIFLTFMGMPLDRIAEFLKWNEAILGPDQAGKVEANDKVNQFLRDHIDAAYRHPEDGWLRAMIEAKNEDGSPRLSREEVHNNSYFLFLAGLDTVQNAMGHSWRCLASRPALQKQIAYNPAIIPSAVEELLRYFALTNNNRTATADVDYNGIQLKRGDPILLLQSVANRLDERFEKGLEIDLEREANVHLTFGSGPHRCLGSNLARLELRVTMEEWFRRIPSFRIQDGAEIRSVGGTTNGLDTLPLEWETV
jgi:cytochrome P450